MTGLDRMVRESIKNCIEEYYCNNAEIIVTNCDSIQSRKIKEIKSGGIYVIADEASGTVFYVGETSNFARRIGREHCNAQIGSSEGVVRFLIYLLDQICNDINNNYNSGIIEKERLIKNIIRSFLRKMTIYLAYCRDNPLSKQEGKKARKMAEKCIRRELQPILNPPE